VELRWQARNVRERALEERNVSVEPPKLKTLNLGPRRARSKDLIKYQFLREYLIL
jgi:hypothetical protein